MTLQMIKFGVILNSRSAAREAVLRAKQILNGTVVSNDIEINFSGVRILTPSFADEFVKELRSIYPNNPVKFSGLDNNVIKDTLTSLGLVK